MVNDKRKIVAVAILFVIILTGSRIFWIASFHHSDHSQAVMGQLDLRDWDPLEDGMISLDGQWEFYQDVWLMEREDERLGDNRQFIQVPGDWSTLKDPGADNPFGYGSYRLLITVNPEYDVTYGIRVPSVRSSSELYVNGKLLAQSGRPSSNEEDYIALNEPYSVSFSTNGSAEIELIIQTANYSDLRKSGIVRSMKFGTEKDLARETRLSEAMQQMVAVVFAMHAVYALILYIMGTRDRRLFYFALLTVSAMVNNLLGTEEKLMAYWFPINYDWGFKLVHLSAIIMAYSLLQCVTNLLPMSVRKWSWGYTILCSASALLSLVLPTRYILMIQPLYALVLGIAIISAIVFMLRSSIKEIKGNLLLLLSLIAFTSNLVWWGFFLLTGIKVVYYPFDLIVAMTCFALIWFKNYLRIHSETEKLALKLQRADKLKDEFLANTSHELRNPLHSILNLSQSVLEREQSSLNKQSVKDLETVLTVSRRMSLMLNDLLDVMSLKENAPRLKLSHVSIQSIAIVVMEMLQSMTEGKPIRLINKIPDDFPNVLADENRVIQIVFNLLHNAIKFTNEGEVSIQGHVNDGKADITIADTGIGMDEDTIRRVFEPYEQADARMTMIDGGFGLGLSISKQLVELHGGVLQASSSPGLGSAFVFSLKLSDQSVVQGEANADTFASDIVSASTAVAASIPSVSFSGQQSEALADRPRILVIDDDPINLKVIESILSTEHYDMTTVSSGKKAMEVLDSKEWDLIISDVMMPQMSGYELSRALRERFTITDLPILLLTARSQPEDIETGFLSGANDYVTKPVEALELRSRVQALTKVKQTVRERLQMEAAWLQAQIQPHFLFNTLNAVAALSQIDLHRMRNLLEVFGDFLRDKFKFQNINELVPIEDELNMIRSYLYIEKERFEDRLHVHWDIDETKPLKIPLFTIQPLVENAVRHGIMNRAQGGQILIRISNFESYSEILVEDDGVGMDEEVLRRILLRQSDKMSGIGLINTDLRLKRQYGSGLQIRSKPGRGTSVSFKVFENK